MANHWQRLAVSSSLLLLVLLAVAGLVALLGGSVFLPQAGLFVWIALGLLVFLGANLLVFRLLGLRSRADEEPEKVAPDDDNGGDVPTGTARKDGTADADWRAWRG